ncbi:MAG: hypothetical protein KDE34_24430, partial [Anaerolineales bacterium]|nr:hypothetical protein [Anaerolineales bacterium]
MNREAASRSLTDPLINDIRSVFRAARGKTAGELPAIGQLLFMQERWRQLDTAAQRSGSVYELLVQLIEQLRGEDELLAAVIGARFLHDEKGRAVAQQLGRSLDQINRLQKKGLSRLVDYLLAHEREWNLAQLVERRERLPAAGYRRLFGLQGQLDILAEKLRPSASLLQLAVVGIGGIGKSTLLHQAVLQTLERAEFDEIVWVQISNQFPAPISTLADMLDQLSQQLPLLWGENPSQQMVLLRRLLAERRCLLVLDNLEREADFNHILREFQGWTGPSVILYGARVKPPAEMGVALLELNQLPPDDARDLLND